MGRGGTCSSGPGWDERRGFRLRRGREKTTLSSELRFMTPEGSGASASCQGDRPTYRSALSPGFLPPPAQHTHPASLLIGPRLAVESAVSGEFGRLEAELLAVPFTARVTTEVPAIISMSLSRLLNLSSLSVTQRHLARSGLSAYNTRLVVTWFQVGRLNRGGGGCNPRHVRRKYSNFY